MSMNAAACPAARQAPPVVCVVQYGNFRGRTCECNLAPACRTHHRAKQAPGSHLSQPEPGTMHWQLPSGRTYTTIGDPYPV